MANLVGIIPGVIVQDANGQRVGSGGVALRFVDNGDGTYSVATSGGGGGGGGGGAVTLAAAAVAAGAYVAGSLVDGADTTQGAKADGVATSDTGAFSLVALIKRLLGFENPSVTLTSISGTITAGGTRQQMALANAARKGWCIQNNSTGDLWVNELGANAVLSQPSLKIAAGQYYESPLKGASVAALDIIGATTGQAFTARQW